MSSELYTFKARATGIPKKDIFGKADPYLVLRTPIYVTGETRIRDKTAGRESMFSAGTTVASVVTGISVTTAAVFASSLAMTLAPMVAGAAVVYAIKYASKLHPSKPGYHEIFVSERQKNTFTPDWSAFQLAMNEPFKEGEILFECWDWDRGKPSDYIGSCMIPVRDLLSATTERAFHFHDHKGRHTGTLYISCNKSLPTYSANLQKDDVDDQTNYVGDPYYDYTSVSPNINPSPVPCRADAAYGNGGPAYGNSPAWGNGYDGGVAQSQGYGTSPGYGNGWGSGYDSLNSSTQSLDASSGYGNSPGYGGASPVCGVSPSPYFDASSGYGNGASVYGNGTQSPSLWGIAAYDPIPSPGWASPYPTGGYDMKGSGYNNYGGGYDGMNSPAWGGYAAQ